MTPDGSIPPDPIPNETRELTTSRVIEAPRERVYGAFLDPAELAAWLHPPGGRCEIHHFEPEVGGTYRITMAGEAPDGTEYAHAYDGTFRELLPGERIVQVERPAEEDPADAEAVTLTVTLEAVPDGTAVTVAMAVPADWPDDGIAGWAAALGNLAGRLDDRTEREDDRDTMTNPPPMTDDTTTETTETSLTVRRTFDAPRERLWRAFTDPDDLAQWYAPGEMTAVVHALEPETGGRLAISMLGDDGSHDAEGTFEAVVENERLVHTWRWTHQEDAPETRVTVEFHEVEGGTEVVLTHEGHPDAEAVESHTEGWTGVLANLAAAL